MEKTLEEKRIDAKAQRKPQTKKERIQYLLNCVAKWIREGLTEEEAIEKLSLKQYDFLIENNVDFDNLLLSTEQQKAVQAMRRTPRPTFEDGYKKKYPESKQELFNNLAKFLETQGAEIIPRQKPNYRDIYFNWQGARYWLAVSENKKETAHFREYKGE